MLASELLLNILEDMSKGDFETFQMYLTQKILTGCRPVPKSHLEDASRTRTVTKMIENYGENLAVKITVEILRKQGLNNLADRLNKDYVEKEKIKPASSSCSSSVTTSTSAVTSPPAAAASVSAQGGSVVIAPMLNGGTTGSWNINIHKP